MIKTSAVAASVIGGAMLVFSPSPASAAPVASPGLATPADLGAIEEVRHRRWHRPRARRWSPRRRHRYVRPYYHSGPSFGFSFSVPAPTLGYGASRSRHVQWCMNRYRTYDPATDTYVPRIGVRARCNSPYR